MSKSFIIIWGAYALMLLAYLSDWSHGIMETCDYWMIGVLGIGLVLATLAGAG